MTDDNRPLLERANEVIQDEDLDALSMELCEAWQEMFDALQRVGQFFDDNTDGDGQWRGADICADLYSWYTREITGPRCDPTTHVGPIVYADNGVVDGGLSVMVRCRNCKATADTLVLIDELEW